MGAFAAERKEPIPAAVVDEPKMRRIMRRQCLRVDASGVCRRYFERIKGVERTWLATAGGTATDCELTRGDQGDDGTCGVAEDGVRSGRRYYGTLLRVFFSAVHDPTQLNRQGPDVGTSYRSVIFYTTPEQKKIAKAYIAQLDAANVFPAKIVTRWCR